MFTLPIVQSWRERAEARARYADLSLRLNEVVDDLYVLTDPDARAATLDLAAGITAKLAELHTPAFGWDGDEDGRPMRVSLDAQALLLRHVAATERAVIHAITWPAYSEAELTGDRLADRDDAEDRDGYVDELWLWTQLAHTAAPVARAACLRALHTVVAPHTGERAAVILAVLAEIDDYRAAFDHTYPPAPPRWLWGTRTLIAVLFTLFGAVAVVPGVDTATRLAVLLGGPAGVYAAIFVFFRVRQWRETGR
ncbi:hypothetical protein ACLQ2P_41705 [Actinomadura citrea]|uniref:hypothetical protein n=1 Tax=Actinomadura citrea TaxID=46158 RepID=UPI003CE4C83E